MYLYCNVPVQMAINFILFYSMQNKNGQGRVNADIEYAVLHMVLLNILDLLISRTEQHEPFHQLDCSGLTLNCTPTAAALSLSGGEEVASRLVYLKPLINVLPGPQCNN